MDRVSERQQGLTWQQALLIEGHQIMGKSLAEDLQKSSELRDELDQLIHGTTLGYAGVLRNFFFESGRDLPTLLASPFVRAFEATPQCREEEANFLAEVRQAITTTKTPPEDVSAKFGEWVETRIPFMVKGLARCVIDAGIIDPLTEEEITRKNIEGSRLWREKNPDQFAHIQGLAQKAAAEAAKPRVFTQEVRAQMQNWFDRGFDYQTVLELLRGIGIRTSRSRLVSTVTDYDDLHYTLEDIRRQQREGFRNAAREIFELTHSRSRTIAILEKLGHSAGKTHAVLNQLGLRSNIDWTDAVEVDGQKLTLENLMRSFMAQNYPMIRQEYHAFAAAIGDLDISEMAYRSKRRAVGTVGFEPTTSSM